MTMYVGGKLRIINFTGYVSTATLLVNVGLAHAPQSNIYSTILVSVNGKSYAGAIVSVLNSSNVSFNGYYLSAYPGSLIGVGTGSTIYGSIAYFTA